MTGQEKQDLETAALLLGETTSDFVRTAVAERIERLADADARKISETTN